MQSVSPVYRLRPGTSVLENDADLVLRAGAIHRHDITIDKQQSDAALIDALHRLACGEDVSPSDDVVDDLEQLVTMGFVQDVQPVRDGLSHVLVEAAFLSDVGGMGDRVTTLEEMLPAELVDAILLGRRSFGLEDLPIAWDPGTRWAVVSSFTQLNRLRALNRLLRAARIGFTAALVDVDNVYLAGIRPTSSGCLECLETKVMTHFPGMADEYLSSASPQSARALEHETALAVAMMRSEIEWMRRFGAPAVDGIALHIHLPTWEFSRSLNLRTALCPACAGLNNAQFEERNLRIVNLLARTKS
ncbi:hypothetical protein [Actinomyces naeslundii]|jgi:hypothetical protein|uniref:hypothetical protein n=1 Tax=Actinomyces naeslundii TaxID=1655 RepID=UPI00096DD884|nr:hypothetical protein [Actinomyces naeslundii]OMG22345.1 hypothetical protein BKH38_02120 [Actinomyces naeslundii]OMG41358.1 hypothetical protein BKH03_07140 [Actinomyces naeslundii]BDH76175.1 hypothetical protein ATCC27039_03010 [Actinomyces naeslundii]